MTPAAPTLLLKSIAILQRTAFWASTYIFKTILMLGKVSIKRHRMDCKTYPIPRFDIRNIKFLTDGELEPTIFMFPSNILSRRDMPPPTMARKELTGFIVNQLCAATSCKLLLILCEGVGNPPEVDMLRKNIFQTEMLPYRLMDRMGLDTVAFVEDNCIQKREPNDAQTVDLPRENYINQVRFELKDDQCGLYPPEAPERDTQTSPTQPDVYFLDVLRRDGVTGKIKTLVSGLPLPDGIAISPSAGRMFWTNMGSSAASRDGSVMSARLDGTDIQIVMPQGVVHTPKQAAVVESQQRLYFCDREGMGVHRVGFDGQNHEVLIQRPVPAGDAGLLSEPTNWCVGVAVDVKAGMVYWTQKGPSKSCQGRIFRAGIKIPAGEKASSRSDIELLFENLPEPIDLEIDAEIKMLYWTDRDEHPRGCSLNHAVVAGEKREQEIITRHFHEPIGLKLDLGRRQVFVADLGGSLYSVNVDSGAKTVLLRDDGCYTGVAVAST